ncbi:MAG TPA: hypothetical protein VI489_02605 [Candidatus Brocadiaceae bacterium]
MQMQMEGKNLVVKIPKDLISKDYVERFIERIELEILVEKSQMTDKEAWKLSEELKEDWWKKNKEKVLKEGSRKKG